MSFAITGGILAGGSVIEGLVGQHNSNKLASEQQNQANIVFGEQQQYAGLLSNLINDPSSVTSLPGYQFQLGQGEQAVARQMAGSGFLGSGNEATALTQYGQGYAQNFYNTYEQQLAALSGLTAPSSTAQLGSNATSSLNSANAQTSNLFGQLGFLSVLAGNSNGFSNLFGGSGGGSVMNTGPSQPGAGAWGG